MHSYDNRRYRADPILGSYINNGSFRGAVWFVSAGGSRTNGAVEVGAEFWMGVAHAADGVADPRGDRFAGAFGGGVGKPTGAAIRPGGAAHLSQELFSLVVGALVSGEVGVFLSSGKFHVKIS